MATGAIGRNPDAAGQIRGLAIILAAFAEGLGVLAIVVGLLDDLHPARGLIARGGDEWPPSPSSATAARRAVGLGQEAEPKARPAAFQINVFWIVVAATTFVFFFFLIRAFAFSGIAKTLEERRARIEQGLKDAEQAARDRKSAEEERLKALQEARREAQEILARAQKVSEETRARDIAATRDEVERIRERATSEIEAEKQRALGELRAEVADLALAAASKVVGESLDDDRQRQLVQEFLAETGERGGAQGLMARPITSARRYAEAAFEIAQRDGQLDRWRDDLQAAAAILADAHVAPVVENPAVPLARAAGDRSSSCSAKRVADPGAAARRPAGRRAGASSSCRASRASTCGCCSATRASSRRS